MDSERVAAFDAAVEQAHQAQAPQEAQVPPPAAAPVSPLPPPAAPMVRMPRIVEWLDVPEYPGFKARCWINPPKRLAADINSADEPRVRAVLKEIILEHNGWADDTGVPLPPAQDAGFWDELGGHLMTCLMAAIAQRANQPPLAPGRRTS